MFQCNLPTKYEKTLIKGFLTQLFKFFPKNFSSKNVFVLPESYNFLLLIRNHYQLHISPDYQVHGLIPSHKRNLLTLFAFSLVN